MESFHASDVFLMGSPETGEGWIEFRWPDAASGWECLQIAFDGFCSRRMPVRSASGLLDVELSRQSARIRFDPAQAKALGLSELVEIRFSLPKAEFTSLREAVENIGFPQSR
jgi:hypothetical protein